MAELWASAHTHKAKQNDAPAASQVALVVKCSAGTDDMPRSGKREASSTWVERGHREIRREIRVCIHTHTHTLAFVSKDACLCLLSRAMCDRRGG